MSKIFTIIDTDTQQQLRLESNATTIGELKSELRGKGIETEGKTIREGISKIEFKDDSAIIPHDVPYKGSVTNNLVFQLTRTNKRVSSGAMSRADAYTYIKNHKLEGKVKAKFGKNFTCCKTNDLIAFINNDKAPKDAPAPQPSRPAVPIKPKVEPKQEVKAEPEVKAPVAQAPKKEAVAQSSEDISKIKRCLIKLIDLLEDNDQLDFDDADDLKDMLENENENQESSSNQEMPYSDKEAARMFDNWK